MIRDPKAHKHKHFIGISLPYWASLRGCLMGYPYPYFCLCAFGGPYMTLWFRFRGRGFRIGVWGFWVSGLAFGLRE